MEPNETTPPQNQTLSTDQNMATPSSTPTEPSPKRAFGPTVGVGIIVLIIVLGGLYFWGAELNKRQEGTMMTPEQILSENDPTLNNLKVQSSADTVDAIEADLQATDLSAIDADLDQVDAELQR